MVKSSDEILSQLNGIENELNHLKKKGEEIKTVPKTNEITQTNAEESKKLEQSIKGGKVKPDFVFDPDSLVLTKKDILDFCDRVLEKWKKDPKKDATHIFAMNAVKTSILWTEEESLKEIWHEILNWNFELLFKNALAQATEQNLSWAETLSKLGKN